jgi:hypothetical protein
MLSSVDSFSTIFGLGFLLVTLVAFAILGFMLWRYRDSVQQATVDKIIELAKWYIVSVGIVVAATIVTNAFKEREADVKEIEVFEKHVATITKAGGIEDRWLLAQYFSTVAPKGDLRDSWVSYRDSIKPEVEKYRTDKAEEDRLAAVKQRNPAEEAKLVDLQKSNIKQEKPLVPRESATQEWAIIAGTDVSVGDAKDELEKAAKVSRLAKIYKLGTQFRTIIPGFATREAAMLVLPDAQAKVNQTAYVVELKSWCNNPRDAGEYVECG